VIGVRQDMHVHSTFSDGRDTIEDNVAEAERLGLLELTCVDHVRVDTDWVAAYAAAVRRVNATTPVVLHCAVEAKLLDTAGNLDLPPERWPTVPTRRARSRR
jgi:putative hydrolase